MEAEADITIEPNDDDKTDAASSQDQREVKIFDAAADGEAEGLLDQIDTGELERLYLDEWADPVEVLEIPSKSEKPAEKEAEKPIEKKAEASKNNRKASAKVEKKQTTAAQANAEESQETAEIDADVLAELRAELKAEKSAQETISNDTTDIDAKILKELRAEIESESKSADDTTDDGVETAEIDAKALAEIRRELKQQLEQTKTEPTEQPNQHVAIPPPLPKKQPPATAPPKKDLPRQVTAPSDDVDTGDIDPQIIAETRKELKALQDTPLDSMEDNENETIVLDTHSNETVDTGDLDPQMVAEMRAELKRMAQQDKEDQEVVFDATPPVEDTIESQPEELIESPVEAKIEEEIEMEDIDTDDMDPVLIAEIRAELKALAKQDAEDELAESQDRLVPTVRRQGELIKVFDTEFGEFDNMLTEDYADSLSDHSIDLGALLEAFIPGDQDLSPDHHLPNAATKAGADDLDFKTSRFTNECQELLNITHKPREGREYLAPHEGPQLVPKDRSRGKRTFSAVIMAMVGSVAFMSLAMAVAIFAKTVSHQSEMRQLHDVAVTLMKEGRLGLAQDKLNQLLKQDNTDMDAYFCRAIVSSKLGDYKQAVNDYSQTLRLKADKMSAYLGRAAANMKLSNFDAVIADCNKVMEKNDKDAYALTMRAIAKANKKDYAQALEDCDALLALKTGLVSADIYSTRAFAQFQLKDYDNALKNYSQAIVLDPKDGGRYVSRAQCLEHLGRHESASQDFDQAVYWSPRDADAWLQRADCYSRLGKMAPAMQSYDKAVVITPSYETFMARAKANLKDRNFKAAIVDFEQALTYKPQDQEASEKMKLAMRRRR